MKRISSYPKGLDILQKISISLMAVLVMVTFVGANLHALLWQQSSWLVSTVLPAVVVDMTNDERQQLNAPELRRNTTLDQAAELKAQHMAENQYFSHFSPKGVSPWHWFSEAGYVYAHAGENLAIHFTDSSEVVDAWMDSPTHRANIVNSNYTEIGVGTAKGKFDGYNTVYVVQLFGSPGIPPVVAEVSDNLVNEIADTPADLSELTAQANELAELVDSLSTTPETIVETDISEVLAENTQVDVIEVIEVDPVEVPTVDVVETQILTEEETIIVAEPTEVLIVESTIATSSGLAVASLSNIPDNKAGTTIVSMITQPNEVLQLVYMLLGFIVMTLLLFSAIFEARQLHFVQVSYSIGLMVSMSALWYVHSLLTAGAVIA